ncbi:uncharacterized protein LOC134834760 [Culicoides brevitarsis]|uniref:uncharacterized protein LOC134834760 n=1 Tax=Culicoides brevitarsis TaxID=469753 RepID=UPI00307B427E
MPDYTNTELMEFICRVLKKVHAIESKLDQFLGIKNDDDDEEKDQTASPFDILTLNDNVDLSFNFNPINDDKELQEVTDLINKDPKYLQNLRLLMQSKRKFCLEDIFTEKFLLGCNLCGINGKRKLEGLAPFEKVYVYVLKLNGEDPKYIRKLVMSKISQINHRVSRRARHKLQKRLKAYEGLEEGQIPVDHDYQRSEFNEDSLSLDEDDSQLDIVKNEPFDEDSDSNEPLAKLVPSAGEEPSSSLEPTKSVTPLRGFPFEPIKTKKEMSIVDERIKEDPEYLEQLRKHFSRNRDNVCRLDQLFTSELMFTYNYSGMHDREKLTDLTLYKDIYFHLKRIQGATLEDIEFDAKSELRRMKKRVYSRNETRRIKPPPCKKTKI